ncbi:MAG: FHA domain-containing protein [Verrucomicrobia bacterium]|nr:FHA domain-containing protein [Verrucomicrobiota bacterium]
MQVEQHRTMAKLVFLSPAYSGHVYQFVVEKTTVGRGDENLLVIRDESVSRAHCEILVNEPEVIVRDLGSRNGTVVNGRKLRHQQTQAKHGHLIRFGSVEARLELECDPFVPTTTITAAHDYLKFMRESAKPKAQPENPSLSMGGDAVADTTASKTVLVPAASVPASGPTTSTIEQADTPKESKLSLVLTAATVGIGLLVLLWLLFRGN